MLHLSQKVKLGLVITTCTPQYNLFISSGCLPAKLRPTAWFDLHQDVHQVTTEAPHIEHQGLQAPKSTCTHARALLETTTDLLKHVLEIREPQARRWWSAGYCKLLRIHIQIKWHPLQDWPRVTNQLKLLQAPLLSRVTSTSRRSLSAIYVLWGMTHSASQGCSVRSCTSTADLHGAA